MKVLSLFTGAGGLDVGLERAGFSIAGCIEVDPDCQQTLRTNRAEWSLAQTGDIHGLRASDVLSTFGVTKGEVVLLAGGPPCQPFSKSAQWHDNAAKRMRDPRARTLEAYFRVLEATLPQAMLLENVKGITAARKRVTQPYEGLDVLRSSLARINRRNGTAYEPYLLLVDAADYGIPQHRERVFVFAARDGSGLSRPAATHGPAARAANGSAAVERYMTAWDAIGHLDDPEFDPALRPRGVWAELLPSIPEGCNYLHHTPRGTGEPLFGWRTRYWSFLLKLAKARPSWTIQAQAGPATGPFHWRSRRLGIDELARLQCFPEEWSFAGNAASAHRQVGNAVPPPVGEALGLQIRREVFGQALSPRVPLVPKARDDCPPPEQFAPVPAQYLERRAQHADHPGAGRGPSPRRVVAPLEGR
ncbi:MAG TPA: DNA cytosine methyltransferase [Solirubrobacteraceae bacterium]|jgi:DNA (cytosine-5)-methyltransferase 1|nr:DNA cytosine methyltransferase [Solirubrobacteraceae bacterium]